MSGAVFAGVRAVLFDLDGTLIDSAPDLGAAAEQMRLARGLAPLGVASYRAAAGMGARGILGVAFGVTPEQPEFAALRDEFLDRYEACIHDSTEVFDGVQPLVDALRARGLRWGVVTNKHERFTRLIAARMPLFASSSCLVSGDTTAHLKPHPASLLEACRRLGLSPAECIYVGDDERDVVAGHAAGMRTVAALYGYLGPGAQALQWGAQAVIERPMQCLDLLA
ncbi:HAD family hydrolase [Comamonas sp. NLF-1-9]|uniref:HAD family hydrolase n=1 Tax=Comamonas sp. NLF-1-9 TaxID=2853163 RepID=UPI001C44CDBF|nr:HAD-IA family hydrolase [Comamonas sp. NLF-1-9]QXL84842.1 HAD-IA family hydrolase [Comamonas sp. NLF-1-9]